MRYTKQEEYAVSFAKWCIREKQNPADIMELCVLAKRAARLYERDCNGEPVQKRLESACERFELRAVEVFGSHSSVQWPGFWPCIIVCDSGFPERKTEIRLP